MNGRTAKLVRREAAKMQREYFRQHPSEQKITLRHRIAFNVLRFAARIGFKVKPETLYNIAKRGVRLVLRNA